MERNNLIKKGVVVAVILLFIGLAFAPSINANISKASIESELVEITTEVCGLNGGKHTVSLSKEDAEEVEQLIDDIERRLNEVETREETIEIFNEAVVELDKYGLLGGLSVEQAQRLVTGGYQKSKIYQQTLDENENRNCLIVGKINCALFYGLLLRILLIIYDFYNTHFLNIICALPEINGPRPDTQNAYNQRLFIDANIITPPNGTTSGWVWTRGKSGVVSWNGYFYGQIETHMFNSNLAVGFTGIRIPLKSSSSFFFGFARHVKIKA